MGSRSRKDAAELEPYMSRADVADTNVTFRVFGFLSKHTDNIDNNPT